ncbi:MAG: VTC domain-containing protein, partial [Lachnospiraceae bacterium]|nr:VTC domain-containing protein [Lachnospiraceae bacterium]
SGTALELYSLLTLGCYRPATIIEYQRTAFSYVENNVRITFDKNIKCSETDLDLLSDNLCYLPAIDDRVILEVKYNGTLLKAISDILRKYNLVQVSVSKYGVGRPIYTKYM